MAGQIRFNPLRAPTTPMKAGGGMKPPGEQFERGVGGAHFTNPTYVQAGHNTTHPGFKAVQSKIAAKEGVSKKAAGAILANSTRHASKAAKKANPRLNRVKG